MTEDVLTFNEETFPIKELGYRISLKGDGRYQPLGAYELKVGAPGHISVPLDEEEIQPLLPVLFEWAHKQFSPPPSYKVGTREISPEYSVNQIYRSTVGGVFGCEPNSIRMQQLVHHPTRKSPGSQIRMMDDSIPDEIKEIFKKIDEIMWRKTRNDIIDKYDFFPEDLPPYLKKHVFIAYRITHEDIARKLSVYLTEKGINVWFFPWRVGWGDSITDEENQGLSESFSGIIIYSPDFLEGKTAHDEYRALQAIKRERDNYKLGIVRVECSREEVPPFLLDYFDSKISSIDDELFDAEAMKIFRGLLGLPLEAPPE